MKFGEASCSGQVAAWITHGRNDDVVSFCLGEMTREHWADANGCDSATSAVGPGECVEHNGCDGSYPVVWCPTDEDHSPPDFSDAEIWDFFARF